MTCPCLDKQDFPALFTNDVGVQRQHIELLFFPFTLELT